MHMCTIYNIFIIEFQVDLSLTKANDNYIVTNDENVPLWTAQLCRKGLISICQCNANCEKSEILFEFIFKFLEYII